MTDEELIRVLKNTAHVTTSYRLFDANAIRKLVNELRQVTRERDWLVSKISEIAYEYNKRVNKEEMRINPLPFYNESKDFWIRFAKEATLKQYSALEPCSFTASNNATPPNNRKPHRKLVRKKLCQIK